jgi:hypothetical protein
MDGRSKINSDYKGLRTLQTEINNWEIHIYDRISSKTGAMMIHLENYFNIREGAYQIDQASGFRGIDGPNHNYIYGRFWSDKESSYQYYLSCAQSGNLEILKDDYVPNDYYIKFGIIELKLINKEVENNTIIISLGRFDLNIGTIQQTLFN